VALVLPNMQHQKESIEVFDKEIVKVFISKNCWNNYLAKNFLLAKPAEQFLKSC